MRARVYVYVHAREVACVSVRVCAWYTVFIYCFLMPSFVVVLFYFLKQFFNVFLLSLSLFFSNRSFFTYLDLCIIQSNVLLLSTIIRFHVNSRC